MGEQDPLPRDCASRFLHVKALARGGYGEVHLARQRELDRLVVIKLLLAPQDTEQLLRFENEALLISRLHHPSLVRLIDYGRETGVPWIALEWIEGENLAALVARGPIAAADVVRAGRDLAAGLEVIHQAGILHRDVKPGNVIRDLSGVHRLLDFGIAKSIHDRRVMTTEGMVVGTLPYMAPEVLTGAPATPASDLYALGILLHELACGVVPFHDREAAQMIQAKLRERPAGLLSHGVGLPRGFEHIIQQLLEIDPAQRPVSAAALQEELGRITTGPRPVVVPATRPVLSARLGLASTRVQGTVPPGSSKARWGAAGAIAVLVAGVVGFMAWRDRPSAGPGPRPSIEASLAPAGPSLDETERVTLQETYREARQELYAIRNIIAQLTMASVDIIEQAEVKSNDAQLARRIGAVDRRIETGLAPAEMRAPLDEFGARDVPLLAGLTAMRATVRTLQLDQGLIAGRRPEQKLYYGAIVDRQLQDHRSLTFFNQVLKFYPSFVDQLATGVAAPGALESFLWTYYAIRFNVVIVPWSEATRPQGERLEARLVTEFEESAGRPGIQGALGRAARLCWEMAGGRQSANAAREKKGRIAAELENLRSSMPADEIAAARETIERF